MARPHNSTLHGWADGVSEGLRPRVGAIVALIAMTCFVAGVAFVTVWRVEDILFGLLLLAALTSSAWLALTRRGVIRLLTAPVAVLGMVALLLHLGLGGMLVLGVFVAMLTLYGLTARYAVAHDKSARRTSARMADCAPPARNGVLIINPKSGSGKAQRSNLVEEARNRNVESILLAPGDDLRELAKRAALAGADVIGMAGGDGSQAIVAAVAMEHDVAHVCVPAGTRNHFALDLGLDRNDIVGALDAFNEGIERRIDLASVNDHVFVNNASLGVYARVVQADAYREAKLRTWRRMLPDLLGKRAEPIDLQFVIPHSKKWCSAALVVVSNNPYQLSRFGGAGTRLRLDSGRLGIVAARIKGARSVAQLVTLGSIGQQWRFGGVREWSSVEFEVDSRASVAVGLDGETRLLTPPLRFASLPGALRVRVSRHSGGVSPAGAAVSITRSDFARLVRIAAAKPAKVMEPMRRID